MADDELLDDAIDVEEGADLLEDDELEDDELEDDELATDLVVEDPDAPLVEDDDEDEEPAPLPTKARAGEDDDEDEEEADPDDVEEDLDTILRDRIAAGADEDEEDEDEAPVDDRTEGGDRVAPRAAEEFSCGECFLLVRRSQFSTKRTDCPGGLDGADCPVKQQLGAP
jgi:hypothetical protein